MDKKVIKKILVIVAAVVLLTGCDEQDDKKVNIGYFPNITHAQALILKGEKILDEKWQGKCDVNWVSFNAGPAEVEALFAQEIDIGYIGPVPAINAYVKSDGDVIILANAADSGAVMLGRKNSGIKEISDLSGKKVAVPQMGNTQHLCLLQLLSESGLAPVTEGGTVEVVAVSNADVMNMMEEEKIDAALVPEPWGRILEINCAAQVILEHNEILLEGNYPTAVVVARKEFVETNPEVVRDFLEAHEQATERIANDEDVFDLINEQIENVTGKRYEDEIIKHAFERIKPTVIINEDAIKAFSDISYEKGFIQSRMHDGIIR